MRIVLYPYTEQAGIGTYAVELANYFSEKNEVYAIGKTIPCNKKIKFIRQPETIIPFKLARYTPLGWIIFPYNDYKIAKIIDKINPDLVFSSSELYFTKKKVIGVAWDYPKSVWQSILLAKKYSSGLFFVYRAVREVEGNIMHRILPPKIDIRLGVSRFVVKKFNELGKKSYYIPPGINVLENKEKKNDKLTICFIAKNHIWRKRKGLQYLLDALMLIDKDFELIVIGNIPFYSDFKLRKYKKIKDRIKLMGLLSREETLKILSKSHILAAPSLYDEFGYMVLEALSLGIPVISSDNESFKDMVTEDCGIITNIKDKNIFAKDLVKLFDKKLLNDMSKNAVKRIKKEFSWNVIIPKIEKLSIEKIK